MDAYFRDMKKTKKSGRSRNDTKVNEQVLQEVYDAHAVVLEDIYSKIGGLAEAFTSLAERLTVVEQKADNLLDDMQFVREELGLIRLDLKEKADKTDLILLERRVVRLERKVAAR